MSRSPLFGLWLAFIAVLGLGNPDVSVFGQQHSVRPDINTHYQNPDFAQWQAAFERPGREVYDQRHRIVQEAGVRPGMVVADIGAGTGLFTLLFAPKVGPAGKVIAVDISPVFVDNVLRRSREQGFHNVQGIVNRPTDVELPPGSIDLAFISDTYHHFEYPQKMLQSIQRALRPGGMLVVIDFDRRAGVSSPWVLGHVRADKETVIEEIDAAGFELVDDKAFLQDNYFLRFRQE